MSVAFSSTYKMERFFEISDLLSKAYANENYDNVIELSNEYLNIAATHKENWNYGNAIHIANTFLGLVAMKHGDVEKAKKHLITSALTPGSPQLNSFGPNMSLAKEQLLINERSIVLLYLKMCRSFWPWYFRIGKIRRWVNIINKGGIPRFGAHLIYHINIKADITL